jgi:hypothetical protein
MESVAAFVWNRWQDSPGIGGSFGVEYATMPYLTACRASEISVRVSPAYFPLSFTSLSGSPVFSMEDSNKMM